MKLFAKYNRINLLFTVIIFLLASIAFSFLIRYVVINQIDEDLRIERNEILSYIQKYGALPAVIEVHDQYITYQKVSRPEERDFTIHNRKLRDEKDGDEESARAILFNVAANNTWYRVTVSKSLEGTDSLIQSILIITIVTIILILAAAFFVNRLVLYRLWQPFYKTLAAVGEFKLSNQADISFPKSEIEEFSLLNQTLSKAINKAQQDYLVLKKFTENASHEMQTPLAVIRSKLDMMIQNEAMTEPQSILIESAYDAIKKLKKLNQSLLLLTEIENHQFSGKESIDVKQALAQKQLQFAGQWNNKQLQVCFTGDDAAVIHGNEQLFDILLNNLLSNAIRHNVLNGSVTIQLQPHQLQISNSGEPNPLDERYLFSRFYKGSPASSRHGLGLSIVKEICDVSGYRYHYQFIIPDIHAFTISWL